MFFRPSKAYPNALPSAWDAISTIYESATPRQTYDGMFVHRAQPPQSPPGGYRSHLALLMSTTDCPTSQCSAGQRGRPLSPPQLPDHRWRGRAPSLQNPTGMAAVSFASQLDVLRS